MYSRHTPAIVLEPMSTATGPHTRCARCDTPARFAVSAGDPATFWHRSEAACQVCLPHSRQWAGFVGPVTLTPLGAPDGPVQIALFELDLRL
jgi:hypothetical protein